MKFHSYDNLYLSNPLTSETVDTLGIYSLISEDEVKYYKYRFPVYYWVKDDGSKIATIYGIFMMNTEDMSVRVDVETLTGMPYADFYNTPPQTVTKEDKPLLYKIHHKLSLKLRDLDIRKKKERVTKNDGTRIQKKTEPTPRSTSRTKELPKRRASKKHTRSGEIDRKMLYKSKQRRPQDGVS